MTTDQTEQYLNITLSELKDLMSDQKSLIEKGAILLKIDRRSCHYNDGLINPVITGIKFSISPEKNILTAMPKQYIITEKMIDVVESECAFGKNYNEKDCEKCEYSPKEGYRKGCCDFKMNDALKTFRSVPYVEVLNELEQMLPALRADALKISSKFVDPEGQKYWKGVERGYCEIQHEISEIKRKQQGVS